MSRNPLTEAVDDRRRRRRVLLWTGALAALLRVAYLAEHARSAFFTVPVLDGAYYREAARALIGEASPAGLLTGFRPLLYPLFLALFESWSTDWGVAAAIVVQHLLGIATTLLVADLGFRLFGGSAAGMLAGALYALAGPPLFFEGEILITSLFTFLGAAQLHFATRAASHDHAASGSWLGLGITLGLALQARPNALAFALIWPVLIAFAGAQRRRWIRGVAIAAAGCLGVCLAFAWWQTPLIGRFQLWPSAGGVNLYLGNKIGADGRIPRQDRAISYGETYRDSVEVFAEQDYLATHPEAAASADPTAISRYWTTRTIDDIRADPAAWLALVGRKWWYLCWNREIPNNKTWAFTVEHESQILRLLPVHWWILFALAPLGAWAAWRHGQRPAALWVLGFLLTHAVAIVAFFVNARFRLPLWPAMAALAGGGAVALVTALRQRRQSAPWLVLAAGLAVLVSTVNLLDVPQDSFARDFFFRSIARLERGDLEGARADAEQSLAIDPHDAAAQYQLGSVALALPEPTLALRAFSQAVATQPAEPRTWNGIGIALELLDRRHEAERAYRQSLDAAPTYGPALANLCLLALRGGDHDTAAATLTQLDAVGFRSLHERVARARWAWLQGDQVTAQQLLAEARAQDATSTEQLWLELSQGTPADAESPSPGTNP